MSGTDERGIPGYGGRGRRRTKTACSAGTALTTLVCVILFQRDVGCSSACLGIVVICRDLVIVVIVSPQAANMVVRFGSAGHRYGFMTSRAAKRFDDRSHALDGQNGNQQP